MNEPLILSLLDQIYLCCSKKIWESRPYKNICIDNNSENITAYWEESKQSEALVDKCDLFHTVNSWWILGVGSAGRGKTYNLFRHLSFETILPALKLTQNCYLHYKYFFIKIGSLIINWLPLSSANVVLNAERV